MGIPEGLYCKIHAKYICMSAGCCFSWTICLTSSASLSAHNVHFSCPGNLSKEDRNFFPCECIYDGGQLALPTSMYTMSVPTTEADTS